MRTLFPSRTLALHERQNEANLPHTCTVETKQSVDDGEGGSNVTWPVTATLACRLSPLGTATERVQAGSVQGFARYLLVLEEATIIPLHSRVRVTIGEETLLLDPHGSNGPRSFEAQRKYECSLWGGVPS